MGFYGEFCQHSCLCKNNAACSPDDGTCSCTAGWRGSQCAEPCPHGTYGPNCEEKCACKNGAKCEHVTGKCVCPAGFTGALYVLKYLCKRFAMNSRIILNKSSSCNIVCLADANKSVQSENTEINASSYANARMEVPATEKLANAIVSVDGR